MCKTINITTTGNTQSNIDLMDHVEIYTDHSNFMLSNSSGLPRTANYITGDYSNAVFFGYPIDGTISTNDTIIYINPEYRGIEYTVNIEIYMSNYENTAITLSLVINEESIPVIDNIGELSISKELVLSEEIISDLRLKYNYVYSNKLEFTYDITAINGTLPDNNVVLNDDTLTVDPNLRGNSYQIQIIAYDPKFTSNAELSLDPYDINCNLVNDSLTFTFTELPSIEFKDTIELSKTIYINAPNNTQVICNLEDILTINETIADVYIISNLQGVSPDNEAYYLSGNNKDAVYVGDFDNDIVTIYDNPVIYINPEYRGNNYNVSFDIYASNFACRTP